VDHELAGESVKGKLPVLKARVIESPVEAIESGYPAIAGAVMTSVYGIPVAAEPVA